MGLSPFALYESVFHDIRVGLGSLAVGVNDADELKHRAIELNRPDLYAAGSLLASIVKKFKDGEVSDDAKRAALELFLQCNEACKTFELKEDSLYDDYIIGEVRQTLWEFFNPEGFPLLDIHRILDEIDVGPGAAVGATGGSFLEKVGFSRLSATRSVLYELYKSRAHANPLWGQVEDSRSALFGGYCEVEGSRLDYAPKYFTIARIICIEPNLNMMFQKGVQALLERRLLEFFGISLQLQPAINAELARRGSLNSRYATIDLSSASDTISVELCRRILPREAFNVLMMLRSPKVLIGETWTELHMLSSMGNAFTFPLQTAIFAAVVAACYKLDGKRMIRPSRANRAEEPGIFPTPAKWYGLGNFGVFGDDIIVLNDVYPKVTHALRLFGFTVNPDKSFNDGNFRESCGSDWFNGQNVRGVYCKTLSTAQDRVSLINRLNVWSANHGIPLTLTCNLLMGTLRNPPLVPCFENDDAGIKVPYDYAFPDTPKDSKPIFRYKRWKAKPRVIDIDEQSRWQRDNSAAVLLAAVKGSLRGGALTVRLSIVRYKYRYGVSPGWDYPELAARYLGVSGWPRWYAAVMMNLTSSS